MSLLNMLLFKIYRSARLVIALKLCNYFTINCRRFIRIRRFETSQYLNIPLSLI